MLSINDWAKIIRKEFLKHLQSINSKDACRNLSATSSNVPPLYKQNIQQFLIENKSNIYSRSLDLMRETTDVHPRTISVGIHMTILLELGSFVEKTPNLNSPLTNNIQMRALRFAVTKKNKSWIETTFSVFKLNEVPVKQIQDLVTELVNNRFYAEAAYIIIQRGLQKTRTLKEIPIPLLLEDKINVMEQYIEKCPETASKLITYLDSVRNKYNIIEELAEDTLVDVSKVKPERFASRTLNKLITRLMKKYNIKAECPFTNKEQNLKSLRFLIYKRYVEGSISADCFFEGLIKTIGSCKEILDDALIFVLRNNLDEARKLADHFNVPIEKRPYELQYDSSNSQQINWEENNDDWGDTSDWSPPPETKQESTASSHYEAYILTDIEQPISEEFLTLRLDLKDDVRFIDTPDGLQEIIDIVTAYDVIGIDCEWKPSFGVFSSNVQMVELMQIATWDNKITKIGFGIKSDWVNIKATLPKRAFCEPKNVLDLQNFFDWISNKHPNLIPTEDLFVPKDVKGLSKLTFILLKKYVNKDEQFSDWGRRPLRENQIKYAALDAFCLLMIYERLYEKCQSEGVDLQDCINLFTSGKISSQQMLDDKVNSPKLLNCDEKIQFDALPISKFKCIADTMLQGLGRNLRICGADVRILHINDRDMEVVEFAQSTGSVILTSGHRFHYLKRHVPAGKCCNVPNGICSYDQLKIIVRRFNLRLSKEDLLSRCVKCNSNKFKEMRSHELKELYTKKVTKYKHLELRYDGLNIYKFDEIEIFYLCYTCGQIYWEGCHHHRFRKKIEEVFEDESKEKGAGKIILQEEPQELITLD
ncbi:exonuclease mut-7-like protein [Dinothrombium tinctorium]|uniref:Exonuclease mut-7-like protein n=1 Tax=Dinothrombium tinctorium TaxID=1965070 RepID=A0A443RNS7_9ACAR|nr:exonuclease mut-7-like protein [Dinothrombium tinctorium]